MALPFRSTISWPTTLIDHIRGEQGRLDILVNDIWGGGELFEWSKPVWDHDLQNGLRMLRLGVDTHLITAHFLGPEVGQAKINL